MGTIPHLLGHHDLSRLLGKGTFAKAYHTRNMGIEEVAIKIMDMDHLSKLGAMR